MIGPKKAGKREIRDVEDNHEGWLDCDNDVRLDFMDMELKY